MYEEGAPKVWNLKKAWGLPSFFVLTCIWEWNTLIVCEFGLVRLAKLGFVGVITWDLEKLSVFRRNVSKNHPAVSCFFPVKCCDLETNAKNTQYDSKFQLDPY